MRAMRFSEMGGRRFALLLVALFLLGVFVLAVVIMGLQFILGSFQGA